MLMEADTEAGKLPGKDPEAQASFSVLGLRLILSL